MSEYATPGRAHAATHAGRGERASASVEDTPAERAMSGVLRCERAVSAVERVLARLADARTANNPAAWRAGRAELTTALVTAERAMEAARSGLAGAAPEAQTRVHEADHTLAAHRSVAANLGEEPRGWLEVSREARILEILDAPVDGSSARGFRDKEQALLGELAALPVAESRQLANRLANQHSQDPIAAAFLRLGAARRQRILGFLNDARRREARAAPMPKPSATVEAPAQLQAPARSAVATWNPDEALALPPGQHYFRVPGSYAVVVDVPWFLDGASERAGRMVSPAKMFEVLVYLRRERVFSGASDDGLRAAALEFGIKQTSRSEQVIKLGADIFGKLGLPTSSSAMVSAQGDGLVVAVRHDAPLGAMTTLTVSGETAEAVYRALAAYTGLAIDPAYKVASFAMTVGAGAVYRRVGRDQLVNLFGAGPWQAWTRAHADKLAGVDGAAISVSSELSSVEAGHLRAWLDGFGLGSPTRRLTRGMYAVMVEVESSKQHRDAIRDALVRDAKLALDVPGNREHGIDEDTLRTYVHAARYESERAAHVPASRLGERVTGGEAAAAVIANEVPAQLAASGGLIVDGDTVRFEVRIDWDRAVVGPAAREAFAKRPWKLDVDWVFERPGEVIHKHTTTGDISRRLALRTGETAGTWTVHAFVRTSHFWPTRIGPLQIEAKTQAARMADLRSDLIGEPAARGMVSVEKDFDIGTVDDVISKRGDDHGRFFIGPQGFAPRTAAERAETRAVEIKQLERLAEELARRPGKYTDAIAAIERTLDRRHAEDRTIKKAEQSGSLTFDVRATFLSRDKAVPSGPLDVTGVVLARAPVMPHMSAAPLHAVTLRDSTRRFDSETMTFTGIGETFEHALERAFVDLCKAYPAGRISLFAEERDRTGKTPTGRTIGFELATTSRMTSIKRKVFAPLVQIGLAFATAAMMAAFPPAIAALPLYVGLVYGTAQTVDEIMERSRNGTLGRHKLLFGQLALDLLPVMRLARPINTRVGLMYVLDAVDLAGNVLVFGAQVKQTFEQLQAQDVAVLARLYADLLALEASKHPSDPALAQLRAELEDRAAAFRKHLMSAVNEAAGSRMLVAVPHVIARAVHLRPNRAHGGDDTDGSSQRGEHERGASHEDAPSAPASTSRTDAPAAGLGEQIAARTSARYIGHGTFTVETARGSLAVEVRRTERLRVRRDGARVVLEVPRGHSAAELERIVAGKLAELAHHDLEVAVGRTARPGELTAQDHGLVAELRVLREQADELAGTASAARAKTQIEALEKRLGLDNETPAAAERRRMVEAEVANQHGRAARAEEARRLGGEHGHPGIEVHSHFMGIVDADVFRQRAAVVDGGKDTGSWIPLLERILRLPQIEEQMELAKNPGKPFKSKLSHGYTGDRITKRSNTGDAMRIVEDASKQVTALRDRAAEIDVTDSDRAAFLRAAEHVAEEASRTALASTPETPFDGAYVLRDAMVKTTFGDARARGDDAIAENVAFDDFIREALLRLAHDGVHYSEQSTGVKKLGTTLNPERIERVLATLIAEGKLLPGQVEVKMLGMLTTGHFGDRDPKLPSTGRPKSKRHDRDKAADAAVRQVEQGVALGIDIGSPEHMTFTEEGMQGWKVQLVELSNLGKASGEPQLARPHVGEGAMDTVDGQPFHTDKNRHIVNDEPSHYARARHNIDMMLAALESLPPGVLDPKRLVVRFGHVTHATPAQAARMAKLGVIAEANLGSNVATGSMSQTQGVHGKRAPVDRFDDHALPTLIYYDTQTMLSTDGADVMQTTLRKEYQRARTVLEAVLAGTLPVRVRRADAVASGVLRGEPVPGRLDERALRVWELTPDERARFERGYRKLYLDVERYYRGRPRGAGGRTADLAEHGRIAAEHGLTRRFGRASFEGSRDAIDKAITAYRATGYTISRADEGTLTVVTSPDQEVSLTLTVGKEPAR